jgi:hypothetical protein
MELTNHAMKITNLLICGSTLLLAACSSGEKSAQAPVTSPATAQASSGVSNDSDVKVGDKELSTKGGQVVESGKYHLELVPEKSANETHLDLYIQRGDDHQDISNAKVLGEVQFPNGQSKALTFTYDADGKHYATNLSGNTAGAYQLKINASIGSDKADGRFSFNR